MRRLSTVTTQLALRKPFQRLQRDWDKDDSLVRRFVCEQRGITKQTCLLYQIGSELARFRVGGDDDEEDGAPNYQPFECITFPFIEFGPDGEAVIRRYKARAVLNKAHIRSTPQGVNTHSFFGWHTIPRSYTGEVCITEGEIDAMTVYQETGRFAISIPNGASSFPQALVDLLHPFSKVLLWFDNDESGVRGALGAWKHITDKYGMGKCDIVRTPPEMPKDANDLFRGNYDLKAVLRDHLYAIPVTTYAENKARVDNMCNEMLVPISPGFPKLALVLGGGWRMGDMSIVTGRREDVLQLVRAICPPAHSMLISQAREWKSKVEGSNGEFRHAVLLGSDDEDDGLEDSASVLEMQRFAWKHQVHITLVVPIVPSALHVRQLQLEHIKGSVETSQIVDLILVVQRNKKTGIAAVDVQKNRFNGQLGQVQLAQRPHEAELTEVDVNC